MRQYDIGAAIFLTGVVLITLGALSNISIASYVGIIGCVAGIVLVEMRKNEVKPYA